MSQKSIVKQLVAINSEIRLAETKLADLKKEQERLKALCPHPKEYSDFDSMFNYCELCGVRTHV